MYATKILLDSVAPCGKRLTTWELTYPRFVHAELMTHRLFSRTTARCARVSYLTHDGARDIDKDIELHDQLSKKGHWSPFEHVAMALKEPQRHGNFIGWMQYRKFFENEHVGGRMP